MVPSEVQSLVRVEDLPDSSLYARWSSMLATAPVSGGYADSDAMSMAPGPTGYQYPTGDAELYKPHGAASFDKQDDAMHVDAAGGRSPRSAGPASRLVRFGAAMIPTPGGRGSNLAALKIQQLRQTVGAAVVDRQVSDLGFRATTDGLLLPDSFREWEEERLEIFKLKGHMLQLKKVLKRQETSKVRWEEGSEKAKHVG